MSYEVSGPALVIQHTGQVFPLEADTVTLGSHEDNLMVLADPRVSPYHAAISWRADMGAYVIEDLGSGAGTYVNEVPVAGPQLLRHGDVIRIGNTIINVRLQPSAGPASGATRPLSPGYEEPEEPSRSPVWAGIIVALLAGLTIVCVILFAVLLLTGGKGTPDVIIQSPAAGAQIATGSEIILQATASGAKDIVLLELSVDGALTATNSNPDGTSSLTVYKPWIFATPGEHVVSAQAYTASGKTTKLASVTVTAVLGAAMMTGTPTPTAVTDTPTPTPTPTPTDTATPVPTAVPPPQIEYFQASPASIYAGECTTLQWGSVSNATEARIDPDIGGVPTPGSEQVCPIETTTYILTATGPGGTSQASTTVVVSRALADLMVDSITFVPNPAVAGQDNEVQIAIRNGGTGAAGAFDWQWLAGSDATFNGRIDVLSAGESTIVTVLWNPKHGYDSLTSEATVDTRDEVVESDETNNQLVATVKVVKGVAEPQTVTLKSESSLDGYRLSDGSGSNSDDILVGNGEWIEPVGELVARGFMSFDLSGIPAGASIESVQLGFYQKEIHGDPYGKLGNLMLEHVYYGGSLDDRAYNTPALGSAMLDTQNSPAAWYFLADPTLASWVQSTLAAGRSRFQLRLQFGQETDGDGLEDWIAIEPGGGALGSRSSPELTITYLP